MDKTKPKKTAELNFRRDDDPIVLAEQTIAALKKIGVEVYVFIQNDYKVEFAVEAP